MNRRPRVLSHPPRHPYVDRFDETVSRVVHRDEPMPRLDAYHDPDWVRRHSGDWDLVHLHFGHEHHPVERMVDVLDAHRSAGTPIVVTVHDLANPHLRPQDDPSLDLLGPMVERARVVTTLTVGCANAVAAHTGVHPRIIPHGPILPADRMWRARRLRSASAGPWGPLLLHAKPRRPSHDVRGVLDAVALLDGGVPMRVLVDRDDVDLLRGHRALELVDLVVHDGLEHRELVRQIALSRGLVLPYRWGTHSGMLELAADVGTAVIGTDAGFVAEQHSMAVAPLRRDHVDPIEMADQMISLRDADLVSRAEDRERLGYQVLAAHERVYRAALGTVQTAPRAVDRLATASPGGGV
ncbi:hypothetical protein [Euzebya pacifica]|uniref:hypothetical protein n=1 Tax=Euzebya pacifica TaxID=1608957 RepID=UPI0030FA3273